MMLIGRGIEIILTLGLIPLQIGSHIRGIVPHVPAVVTQQRQKQLHLQVVTPQRVAQLL